MSKKIYTLDIKLQVVKYVVNEKHSIGEAVEHFKIPYQSIRIWIKHYEHIGIAGLSIKHKKYDDKGPLYLLQEQRGRSKKKKMKTKKVNKSKEKNNLTEKELMKRIQYLETENAYLKKLNALIQEKEKSKKEIK